MKKILIFICSLAAVLAAVSLTSCKKKTVDNSSGSGIAVADIPYVSDLSCNYYDTDGNQKATDYVFEPTDEVYIKINFTLSVEAYTAGMRNLTIKFNLPRGFEGRINEANTSATDVDELTATFAVDDRSEKQCSVTTRLAFNYCGGNFTLTYSYDGGEFSEAVNAPLNCNKRFYFRGIVSGGYTYYTLVRADDYSDWLQDVTSLALPEKYMGKPVTALDSELFSDCKNLTNIDIPDTVTSIGANAFVYCDNLKYKEYGPGKYLGNKSNPYRFLISGGTYQVDERYSNIHPDTKIICDSAFSGCSGLRYLDFPVGITHVGKDAFKNCSALQTVAITDLAAWCGINFQSELSNPLHAGADLVLNGNALKYISVPDGVTSIGSYAFANSKLTRVPFPTA